MGFYINDDYWAAISDYPASMQNSIVGSLTRLYFTGEDQLDSLKNKTARSIYLAIRERVAQARSKSQRRKSAAEDDVLEVDTGTPFVQAQNADFAKKRESESEKSTCEIKEVDTLPTMEQPDLPSFVQSALTAYEESTKRACRFPSPEVVRNLERIAAAGYTIDDVRFVCDSKAVEWGDDKRMSRYLRPETLFSSKFESYLNAAKADPGKAVRDAAVEYADAF